MFSKNAQDLVYIIEYLYIAGVAQDKLNELDKSKQSHYVEPDVFFVQQRNDSDEFNQSILNVNIVDHFYKGLLLTIYNSIVLFSSGNRSDQKASTFLFLLISAYK